MPIEHIVGHIGIHLFNHNKGAIAAFLIANPQIVIGAVAVVVATAIVCEIADRLDGSSA